MRDHNASETGHAGEPNRARRSRLSYLVLGILGGEEDQQATRALRLAESTGRPVGSDAWLAELERSTGRNLLPRKPGRKTQSALAKEEN